MPQATSCERPRHTTRVAPMEESPGGCIAGLDGRGFPCVMGCLLTVAAHPPIRGGGSAKILRSWKAGLKFVL
ncbi:hypothetical protein ALISP_3940 [Alicycliphilus sp. B1]|nr:hypothetical protein ALISP_1785 [Alicycliphilus sp. B1]GAO24120.1 hypothetical protein ALISP_3940 [Alicycliphilus sp. B1]